MISGLLNDESFELIKLILTWVEIFFVIYLVGYSTFLFVAVVTGSVSLYKKKTAGGFEKRFPKGSLYPDQYHCSGI